MPGAAGREVIFDPLPWDPIVESEFTLESSVVLVTQMVSRSTADNLSMAINLDKSLTLKVVT